MADDDDDRVEQTEKASANQAAAILWVADNINSEQDAGDEATCPGPNARAMLEWVREHAANKSSFYTRLLPLVMPSRAEMDAMQRQKSDMESNFELIAKVLAAAKKHKGTK